MDNSQVKLSKFLSYALRHKPAEAGVSLSKDGWASTNGVLDAALKHGHQTDLSGIIQVVQLNDKQRFELSSDNAYIRARQGHSVEVDLGLEPTEPPEILYHGTVEQFIESIRRQGLLKGKRQHVHLSKDEATAAKVGSRRGIPVILRVRAREMNRDGLKFFLSTNGVWLTDHVPPSYIKP